MRECAHADVQFIVTVGLCLNENDLNRNNINISDSN